MNFTPRTVKIGFSLVQLPTMISQLDSECFRKTRCKQPLVAVWLTDNDSVDHQSYSKPGLVSIGWV